MIHKIEDFSPDLKFAIKTAKEAGEAIRPLHRCNNIERTLKADKSDVSEADYLSNDIVIRAITAYDPSTPILTEETKDDFAKKYPRVPASCWVIDPLDATTIFLEGYDAWLVLITKLENNLPEIAVAYQPMNKTTYFAERNKGAFKMDGEGNITKLWRTPVEKTQSLRQKSVDIYDDSIVPLLGREFSLAHGFKAPVIHTSSYDLPHFKIGVADDSYDFNIFYLSHKFRSQNTGSGLWDHAPVDLILREANCEIVNDRGLPFVYEDPLHVCQMAISLAPGLDRKIASEVIRSQLENYSLPMPRN